MVELLPLPDFRRSLIVVGSSLRKNLAVLKPYFQSLAWQELPAHHAVHYCFVDDFTPEQADARDFVREWLKERGGELLRGVPGPAGDFSDAPNFDAHQWSLNAMRRVGQNRNKILRRALELKADFMWNVDADLIMDPTTLKSLLAADKPLTTAVYWTHWTKRGAETRKIHAAPQVWLRHPYDLNGRGMDEAEFRSKLIARDLTRVWGFGACTLIKRAVIEAGVDFSPATDFPQEGLNAGEDRQFCVKAERLHIDAYADAWPDIAHIYHLDAHLPRVPEWLEQLGRPHPTKVLHGDLVSLKLEALEPLPYHAGGWTNVPRQHLRGRLGQLPLLPELEEAVANMERGTDQIIPVHFPVHYPLPYLRSKRRLIRVTLVDVKPFGFPPILDAELFVGPTSKRVIDTTTMTMEQLNGMKEVALANV